MLIKYDSLNAIKFYKNFWTDGGFWECRSFMVNNNLYLINTSKSQYTYDNGPVINDSGLIVLKIDPANGNKLSAFAIPLPLINSTTNSTIKRVCVINNVITLFLETKVPLVYNSVYINTGKYFIEYTLGGSFIRAGNINHGLSEIQGFLSFNNRYYLFGANDTTYSGGSNVFKFDQNFNLIKSVNYGIMAMSPVVVNNKILLVSYSKFGVANYADKNKLFLSYLDTDLNVLQETKWGLWNEFNVGNSFIGIQNHFGFLSVNNNQVVFSFIAALSTDSLLGCNSIFGKTSTNIVIETLDTNLNCKNTIQIANGDYFLNTSGQPSSSFDFFAENYCGAVERQVSVLLRSHRSTYMAVDTPFLFYLNQHKYPLASVESGNWDGGTSYGRSPDIISLHFDKWLETFMPERVRYCVGDTLKLGYKKWGNWNSGTTFRLEACTNPAFPTSGIRLLGTFIDTVNTENMLYTRVVIPNMGGGQFYLRLKSIGPDRISNLADTTVLIYNLPAVNAGPDQTVCFGDSVQLAGANFGAGFYWTGSKPNLLNDSLIISPTFKAIDSVYAVLHTVNGNGCFNSDTVRIHVIPEIKLSATIDSLYPKCMNTYVKLNVGTHYNDSITVSWGDGTDTILKGNNHLLWHTYTTTGTLKLRIKVVAGGCADSVLLTNLVRVNVRVNKSADTTICFGQSVFLNVNATGADSAFTYLYKVGNTIYNSSNGWFIDKPVQNTLYKAGTVNACMGDTLWDSIRVTVIPPLKINTPFTDTTLCIGNAITPTAWATGGRSSGRVFTVNDGLVSKTMVDSSAVVSPVVTTTYWLHVEDGCTTPNDSVAVVVHVLPKLTHAPLPDLVLCENETLQVQSTPHGGDSLHYSYAWKDVNTGAFLSTLASFAMPVLNSTDIVLQITDNRCATWTDTFTVDVIPDLNRWIAVTPTSGCVPLTVHWQIGALAALKPASYVLVFDAGDGSIPVRKNISTAQAPFDVFYTYSTASDFTARVHLYDRNGRALCNPVVQKIRVFARPKAAFTPVPLRTNIIRPDITFSNQSIASDSYLWSFGDGITQSDNNPSVIHHYTDTGTYTVQLIALTNNGCSDTAYGKVWVMDSFTCFIPNTFSPNADKRNDTFKPVCTNTQYYILTVYNRWGEVVYQSDSQTSFPEWMPVNEPDGVYIYSISAMDRNNEVHTFKGTVMILQ